MYDDIPVRRGEQEHTHPPKREEGLKWYATKGGTISIPTIYNNYSRAIQESDPLASAAFLSNSLLWAMLYGLAEAAILHYRKLCMT